MSITINGTTGVSGVDGTAATPAVQGGDTNTGVFFPAADTVAITTGGTERMRVDSSGNVIATGGISSKTGSNSYLSIIPTAVVTNSPYLAVFNAANTRIGYANYWTGTDYVVAQTDGATALAFGTNGTERMRIDSTGAFGIGGANYGTSGQVLTSGGAGAAPSWTSAALGSTTVTNKTGSRATATTYQNTTNGWLLVCYCMSNNGVTFLVGSTSGLGITALSSNFSGNVQTYLVPPGWYYRATGTVLSNWTEGQA